MQESRCPYLDDHSASPRGWQERGVVVRCTRLPHSFARSFSRFASSFSGFASGSSGHFASPTSGICGVPGVPTSTRCKTWWGASLRSWFQCIRLWHRTCKTSRGTSLRSWFKCTRLWHRTCKTRQGTSLRLCFQKKCLLARGFGTERARLAGALRYARGLSAQGFRARVGGALR